MGDRSGDGAPVSLRELMRNRRNYPPDASVFRDGARVGFQTRHLGSGLSKLRRSSFPCVFVPFKIFGNNAKLGGTRVGLQTRQVGLGPIEVTRAESFSLRLTFKSSEIPRNS